MMFDNYEELVEEVSQVMQTKKKKKRVPKPRPQDDTPGGEIPLDEVLPPAHGHQVGPRIPTNSSRSMGPSDGPWVEGIESRLCRLLEDVQGAGDQSVSHQKELQRGKVGMTGVEGHTKANEAPKTTAAARRQAVDPYAAAGLIKRQSQQDKSKKDADKEMEEALKDMDQANEIESTPSGGDQVSAL
jgi:hypothetical protein